MGKLNILKMVIYRDRKTGDLMSPQWAAITPLNCIDLRVKWAFEKG